MSGSPSHKNAEGTVGSAGMPLMGWEDCPDCHGLGHRPGPLHVAALGVVYDEEE